jgi:zinc transporter ZupT
MTPTVKLYWLRVLLGIVAAVITAFASLLGNPSDLSTLLNAVSIAIIVYFISYYVLRAVFKSKIEKQSKILSTGIGMYFFAWLATFILFYTALRAYF